MPPTNRRTSRTGRPDDRAPSRSTDDALTNHSLLTIEEERRLGQRIRRDGDRTAINQLVRHNILFAMKLAHQFKYSGVELDDLKQQANLGLIDAAESFDPTYECRFVTYAAWHIRKRIFEALNSRHMIRRPSDVNLRIRKVVKATTTLFAQSGREPSADEVAQQLGLPIEVVRQAQALIRQNMVYLDSPISSEDHDWATSDIIRDAGVIDPEILLLARQEMTILLVWFEKIRTLLKGLKPRDEQIFLCRYGLDDETYVLRRVPAVAKIVGVPTQVVQRRTEAIIRWLWTHWHESNISLELMRHEIQRAHILRTTLIDHSLLPRID